MNIFKYGLIAVLAAGLTSCPGGGGKTGTPASITSFVAKVANTTGTSADVLNLAPQGGTVEFSWAVTGADSISISNGITVPSPTTFSGTAQKNITTTTSFVLTAVKSGANDATKTVTVNVEVGRTINVTVKKFNGEPATGLRVQVGDANTQNNQQTTTNNAGVATFNNVASTYTVSAVPTSAIETPVSFKGVTRADPTVVLEPLTGVAGTCSNTQEGLIRFRLPGGTTVDANPANKTLGYVYFIPEGRRADAVHEDSLKSNAVQVLKPGQSSGYIRVRFSQNSCPSQVTGTLLYMERQQGGYTFSGVLKNVVARPGVTLPAGSDPPYQIPTANLGSKAVSGQVVLPGAFTDGVAFAVAEINGGAVIVSDPRDIKFIDTTSQGRTFAFNLPGDIGGSNLKYRIGVFAKGPKHTSWFFSDNLYPLPNGGLNGLSFTTTSEFQAQSPVSDIPVTDSANIPQDFDWTDVNINDTAITEANLYYLQLGKAPGVNCPELNPPVEVFWSAVSVDKTSNQQRSQFRLPVLPQPAKLSAGAPGLSCKYQWLSSNGLIMRQASNTAPTADAADTAVDSDKILDGRLILKRHYIRTDGSANLRQAFFETIPVWVRDPGVPTETNLVFRDEIMKAFEVNKANPLATPEAVATGFNAPIPPAAPVANTFENDAPNNLDVSGLNSNADAPFISDIPPAGNITYPGATILSTSYGPIDSGDRTLLNTIFTKDFVGPFNNPGEIKAGTIAKEFANFSIRTQ